MNWSRSFEKHFSAALLVPLPLIAFLNAEGMGQLVGATLGCDARLLALSPAHSSAALPPPFHSSSAQAILDRNPFDSEARARGSASFDPLVPPEDAMGAPPCDGVRVVAIAASDDASWSLAALRSGSGNDTASLLRRRGDTVGSRTVVFVGWDRVWLGSGDRLCQSALFAPAETVPTKGEPPPPFDKRIRRVGATRVAIDRGLVEEIIENYAHFLGTTHVVAEQENGKTVGFRISGVSPGALSGALGLENGDRLETVNGFDLARPDSAIEAYARLRTADHLTLHVNRGGHELNLDYDIQ